MFGISKYTIDPFTVFLEITVTRWSRYNLDFEVTKPNLLTMEVTPLAHNLLIAYPENNILTIVPTTINNVILTDTKHLLTITADTINNLVITYPEPNNLNFTVEPINNLDIILYYNRVNLIETGYNNTITYLIEQLKNNTILYVEGAEIDGDL